MRKSLIAVLCLLPAAVGAQTYDADGRLLTNNTINDGSVAGAADVINTTPGGTEYGLVCRAIPSGTQTVTGTVTADTELPAAAALSENFANPTAPAVGAFGMLWDGANWDRFPGTSADGALVNLGANNDVTITSGSVTCNAGTNLNTSALALESGGNLAAAATSLAIIDDWDESDRAKVNPIVGQAGVAGGSGAAGATTQRVIQANDSTITVAAANNDGACITVTGSSTSILASNSSRRGMILTAATGNSSIVYVKFGSTATVSDFPFPAGASLSMFAGGLVYTGAIDAIRSSLAADQSFCVVEW